MPFFLSLFVCLFFGCFNPEMLSSLVTLLLCRFTMAFYTNAVEKPDPYAKTHTDITNKGIFKALAYYIINNKDSNYQDEETAFRECFKPGSTHTKEMFNALAEVRVSVADTQVYKANLAYIHCHADQIRLAHNHVISCKQKLVERKENLVELRRQLGECLYTVQSFYSNTNWVELNGTTPYLDFGVKDKQLMPVAESPGEDTCRDMPDMFNCKDNLLTDKLTGGYYEGRGPMKPIRDPQATAGKCSHGGLEDESRFFVAKCGINKDTTDKEFSPHYHLHYNAYDAAVEATKQFLIGEDGVLSRLGHDTFDSMFNVFKKIPISLAFAVDYSGSMSAEIEGVKEQIIQLVYSTMNSENEPSDYVLSLFNDPARLNNVNRYTDGGDMIKAISNVVVDGGGDCPELACAGILNAIQYSRPGSTVMVFTDADAKDFDREQEVIDAATAKNIKISLVMTGQCSRRKRRDISVRFRRSSLSLFQKLASKTGGKVYEAKKDKIGETLVEVMKDVFPVSEVLLDTYKWKKTDKSDKDIIVDESMQVLKISVMGGIRVTDVDFINKKGQVQKFPETKAKRIYTRNREIIMSLQQLKPGTYHVRRSVDNDLFVNITAQSYIDMKGTMYQHTSKGSLVTLTGSPVADKNYTYFVTTTSFVNGTCNNFIITDENGEDIYSVETKETVSDIDVTYTARIQIPSQAFRIKVNVTDKTGVTFYRTMSELYRPSSVQLVVTSAADDIPVNKENMVSFLVINTGATNDSYKIDITDDHAFALRPRSLNLNIAAGESIHGYFKIRPKRAVGMFSYNVRLSLQPSNEIKQSITRFLVVTETERPNCIIVAVTEKCETPSLNTGNCSSYLWNATLQVNFKKTRLGSISATSNLTISHDDIASTQTGPVNINISSDCCSPMVSVSVLDVDGFLSQCNLDLSDGRPVMPVKTEVQEVEIKSIDSSNNDIIWMIIIIAVGGLLLVATITSVIIGMSKRKKQTLTITYKNGGHEMDRKKTHSFAYKIVKLKQNEEDIQIDSDN